MLCAQVGQQVYRLELLVKATCSTPWIVFGSVGSAFVSYKNKMNRMIILQTQERLAHEDRQHIHFTYGEACSDSSVV